MKSALIKSAEDLGFALVKVTTADSVDVLDHLEDAIADGRTAEMKWLARNPEWRCDPASLLPGAKSVICLALAYGDNGLPGPETRDPKPGKKARYARGADYHVVVKDKLKRIWSFMKTYEPNARAKLCVDTSPIVEKALAERAGIGWIGKHTLLVNRDIGSWFILGEIITDLEIEPDVPVENMCGDCRKCIDACPTDAIKGPCELDARKCISYLTTVARRLRQTSHESQVTSHGFSYGCDICQEACPYNAK